MGIEKLLDYHQLPLEERQREHQHLELIDGETLGRRSSAGDAFCHVARRQSVDDKHLDGMANEEMERWTIFLRTPQTMSLMDRLLVKTLSAPRKEEKRRNLRRSCVCSLQRQIEQATSRTRRRKDKLILDREVRFHVLSPLDQTYTILRRVLYLERASSVGHGAERWTAVRRCCV